MRVRILLFRRVPGMNIESSDFNDHLVRGLAHKMNNYLTLFHGYLGLLLDNKTLEPSVMDGLAQIKEGAEAASELIDRTKALARPSSVVWREVDLGKFLRESEAAFKSALPPKVGLQIVCPDAFPKLWVDSSRLRRAIIEIVSNAGDVSRARGTVRIVACDEADPKPGARKAARAMRWISITISDTGPGIPKNLLRKIFQPFFTTKTDQQSNGLGLSVALGLVHQLGGAIRLTSKPGNTEFRILLPARSERYDAF
ncbi:MAG: HAMP domain-containing histidine kinase [Verrucomicrobiota bacterium]|nr:HAMP domain-containing histidine kinase [Verrucomicrobiota bacterium]